MARASTKERMIEAAAGLFQRDGYDATSWRRLVDEAGTPWGSSYHHFPGGKEELAVAAMAYDEAEVAAAIAHCFQRHDDPGDAIEAWFRGAAKMLRKSGYSRGCRVATVALETVPDSPPIAAAIRSAVSRWKDALVTGLTAAGIDRGRARELALLALVNIEGALLMSRVLESPAPLESAAAHVAALVRAEGSPV